MSSHQPNDDEFYMRRALALAAQGEGAVEPNPMVGALLVRDGAILCEGFHQQFGGPHAEVNALRACPTSPRGATIYVTLEPCCHHGKTPPCVDALLAAGVARVVVALEDPFPAVRGKGIAALRAAGIEVEVGLLAAEARELLAPYLKRIQTGKPWVIAKWAMTLDGKIAARDGSSQWISSDASRDIVHQLRGRMGGILVGAGTVIADNPSLTARPTDSHLTKRIAKRILIDRSLRSPLGSALFETASQIPTLLVTSPQSSPRIQNQLRERGVEILLLQSSNSSEQIDELLTHLAAQNVTNLLVEGGGEILGAFLDANAIDEVHVFIAPKLLGGKSAPSPIAGSGLAPLSAALGLAAPKITSLGSDLYVTARTQRVQTSVQAY